MDTIRQFEGAMADGGLGAVARALVEACVNEVMSAQADAMCEETGTSRNGFRERGLETRVGAITLRVPKLRKGTCFPEGIVERRGRVGRVVICAASEMFAPGVSTRKVGKVLEKMGAARLSEDRVSRICFELDAEVSELRGRDLSGRRFPYPWVDAAYAPCRRGGHGAAAAVAAAVVGEDGIRGVVGLARVDSESYASWKGFLRGLRERGLEGVRCATSDAHGGIVRAVREVFPGAAWRRRAVHLERDVVSAIPTRADRAAAGRVPRAAFAEEDPAMACAMYQAARGLISRLSRDAAADALAHLDFPAGHRRRIRTNNVQERLNREIKRRSRVVQSFPSEASLVRLVGAVCCEAREEWSSRRYMELSGIEALWERSAAPLPDPGAGQVDRARSRIIALAGLDWMEGAA